MRVMLLATLTSLALSAGSAFAGSRSTCYSLEQVDVPSADGVVYPGTSWYGVNNLGVFSGNFCVDADCSQSAGAVYDSRDGSIETFQVEGYEGRIDAPRINDLGEVVGTASVDHDGGWPWGGQVAYHRAADGTITVLEDYPGFNALDINNAGEIVGFFIEAPWLFHGAIISGEDFDTIEYYEIDCSLHPDIECTDSNALWGITDDGDLLASWEYLSDYPWFINGLDTGDGWEEFELAAGYEAGTAWAMNNRGQVAGAYLDYDDGAHPGFVRDARGHETTIWWGDPADMIFTAILDIADNGVIAGSFDAENCWWDGDCDQYNAGLIGTPYTCRSR